MTTVGLASATKRLLRWIGVYGKQFTTAPPSEDQVVADLLELAAAADRRLQLSTDQHAVRDAVQRLQIARDFYLEAQAEALNARAREREANARRPEFIGPSEELVALVRLQPGVTVRRWTEVVRKRCRIAMPCHPKQQVALDCQEQTRRVFCRTCCTGYLLHLIDEQDGGFAADLVVESELPILTRARRTQRA